MKKPTKKNPFKYRIIGTQIAITIFCGVFIGHQLDNFFKIENHYITIILTGCTIFYVLYDLVNSIKKEK